MRPTICRLTALLACTAPLNCSDVTGPDGWVLQSAFVTALDVVHLDGTEITAPLSPGDAVAIVVNSGGSSSCTRPGPVSVDPVLNQVRVLVSDWVRTTEAACTRDLRIYARQLLHTFFEPGIWTVRALGEADTSVRVTVGTGDAGAWELRPALALELRVAALTGAPLPDTVPLATPVAIVVTSGGSSTCSRPGPVTTTVVSRTVAFDVQDWERTGPGIACTDDLRPMPRTYLHTLFVPGEHVIRAVGAGGAIVERVVVTASEK